MNPSRLPFRKLNRRMSQRSGRKHLIGRNYHHMIPRSRGGVDAKQNLLLISIEKHELWHRLWGNRTAEEVLDLLQRVVRAKKHQSSN